MNNKSWSALNEYERNYYLKQHESIVNYDLWQTNLNSSILTNWLYALNISALGATIALVSTKILCVESIQNIWLFLMSLLFCIIATGVEWLRFSVSYNNRRKLFRRFFDNEINIDMLDAKYEEHRAWLWGISILRALGYLLLICGAHKQKSLLSY